MAEKSGIAGVGIVVEGLGSVKPKCGAIEGGANEGGATGSEMVIDTMLEVVSKEEEELEAIDRV